jgi:hypothetical protein|tara:strand:+ start:1414 stop:1587 length:174 start_codon:yes stop_codon:yes gene_type:complete
MENTINLRALLHKAIDAEAIRSYGGEGNATMKSKYYGINRGLHALRLTTFKDKLKRV